MGADGLQQQVHVTFDGVAHRVRITFGHRVAAERVGEHGTHEHVRGRAFVEVGRRQPLLLEAAEIAGEIVRDPDRRLHPVGAVLRVLAVLAERTPDERAQPVQLAMMRAAPGEQLRPGIDRVLGQRVTKRLGRKELQRGAEQVVLALEVAEERDFVDARLLRDAPRRGTAPAGFCKDLDGRVE